MWCCRRSGSTCYTVRTNRTMVEQNRVRFLQKQPRQRLRLAAYLGSVVFQTHIHNDQLIRAQTTKLWSQLLCRYWGNISIEFQQRQSSAGPTLWTLPAVDSHWSSLSSSFGFGERKRVADLFFTFFAPDKTTPVIISVFSARRR